MKTKFLFPNRFKWLGWLLFIPAFLFSISISLFDINIDQVWRIKVFAFSDTFILNSKRYFTWIENGVLDEVLLFCLVIGGILIGFSKLKMEDEFTNKIRYESLVWATYLNYGLILFFTIFIYGLSYLNVLIYNTFTLLFFFILRFHYMIYKLNKTTNDDE
ncbi:hypothetical protein [Flavobacterium capsici]|uniref:Uncharacterized protein n=1 Tax=Flavobacterium capsici TaxID=3075618 RepID=A0AA96EWT9_9FLAO|nr:MULTISPECIES: hypothetical protein [unclassified Flavobacterium]WNM18638.1 hypothetical protein RN608_11530 [Flavobacterium sp. PMR2A8]WNM22689.1 hypothetical protein RN605_04830 [Flavobacterium sp. PMTSA4]